MALILTRGHKSLLFLDLHAFAVQYTSAVNPPKITFLKKKKQEGKSK